MKSVLSPLSMIFGALSVVMLVQEIFDENLASALQILVEYYEAALTAVLGWLEVLLASALSAAAIWLGITLKLDPIWKHVFVLMMVPVVAVSRTNFDSSEEKGLQVAFFGSLVALSASTAFGVTIHADTISYIRQNPGPLAILIFVPIVPTISVLLLDYIMFGRPLRPLKRVGRVAAILVSSAIALLIVAMAMEAFVPRFDMDADRRRPMLAFLWAVAPALGYAAFLVALGGAKFLSSPTGSPGATETGKSILATFGGALAFLLTNAGLERAGL